MKYFRFFYTWIIQNKEWIFSGIGISLIGIISNIIKKKHKNNRNPSNSNDDIIDDSKFISEDPPDGIVIPVGEKFIKTWTIKNNGRTIWKNRVLRCTEYPKNCFFPVKEKIKIPKTHPGEIITLKVEYYVAVEGDYSSKWKMFDENNNKIYPNKSIGLGVNIMARKNN